MRCDRFEHGVGRGAAAAWRGLVVKADDMPAAPLAQPHMGRARRDMDRPRLQLQALFGHHGAASRMARSEEHTSELQSLMRISYAVFCLKKKKHKTDIQRTS